VLFGRLHNDFTKSKLFNEEQFGFHNHSAFLTITDLQEHLFQNLDNELITCVVFLDLTWYRRTLLGI